MSDLTQLRGALLPGNVEHDRYVARATDDGWAIFDKRQRRFVHDDETINITEKWPLH